MKRIRKTHPPSDLSNWIKTQVKLKLDCSYNALCGKPEHISLKKQLLKEQGYLCAYTGIRIEEETCHVEHLKPQNICKTEKDERKVKKLYLDDVEYRNIVACFPEDGGDISHGYGAPIKGGWWNEVEFVSPCHEDCERRFSYKKAGKISPFDENDVAAIKTIEVIGLNAQRLIDKRSRSILGFFGLTENSKKKLSKDDAQRLLENIGKPDSTGKLIQFCFVYEQLLPNYIKNLQS